MTIMSIFAWNWVKILNNMVLSTIFKSFSKDIEFLRLLGESKWLRIWNFDQPNVYLKGYYKGYLNDML